MLVVRPHVLDAVTSAASDVRGWGSPGQYRCYNVDFSREFRYCLETGTDPTPEYDLSTMEIAIAPHCLANGDVGAVIIDNQRFIGNPVFVLECVRDAVRMLDPDVLIVNSSGVLSTLYEAAERHGVKEFHLGRLPGFELGGSQQLIHQFHRGSTGSPSNPTSLVSSSIGSARIFHLLQTREGDPRPAR